MLKQFAKIKKIQHFIAENQLYFESFVCKKNDGNRLAYTDSYTY